MLVEDPIYKTEEDREMSYLFDGCKNLINIIFIYDNLIWGNNKNMYMMLNGCSSLQYL